MMLVEVVWSHDCGAELQVREISSGNKVDGQVFVLPDEAVKAFWGARATYEEAEATFARFLDQAKESKGGE